MATVQYSGVRESKPGRINDLGTTGKEVEENFKKGCLKRADRSFAQGLQCQQINSMAALMSLEDSVFISHSPQGCVGCSIMAVDMYRVGQAHRGIKNIKNPRIIVTNIDQKSVVFGGEQKLRDSVKKAVEQYNPKLAFIYASCASGIIGDDIDAIASDLQQEYPDTIMVPIHCEGFKSKICASGFDAAFLSINKYILKKEKVPKEKGLVNLFAPTTVSFADQKEMERMLSQIGIKVNYIPFYSSLEKIKKIPAAEASTSICKVFADEFMKTLWEDYDIPYSHTVMPIGIRNTDKWYRGIAKVLGKEKEVEEIIAMEHKRIEPLVAEIRDRLQGKRVFICGGTGRSFAAAALIDDFGMELVGLETPTYDEDAQVDIEYLNGIHKNFVVDIANMQPFEQANLVNKLKPDAFIGVPEWAAKLGIPTTHVLDGKRPTMGYDGLLYLGNKIADQLQNPGFNVKLAKHVKLPYKIHGIKRMHLSILKEVFRMSQILENPRGGCVLAGINSVLGALDKVCPILHAGPGCCMQTSAAEQGQSGHKSSCFVSSVSIPSSNMLEKEVVFGGTDKLRTTIQGAIDIMDADAFFVLTGCTAGIIGDDIVSVTQEFQDKGHEVYPIETPGFAGDSNLGYEVVWNAMIDQVIEEDVPKDGKLVNIFGIVPYHDPFWSGTLEEIDRILSLLGLRVNTFFTKHQGINDIKKCSGAALNIIVNPWLWNGPAKKFEEKFGVPSIRIPGLFIGATDTTGFVREVAKALDLDDGLVEKVIAAEEDYVYRYLAQSVGVVSWKRFAVVADANNAVGITRYLANDFSFTPVLVIISEPMFRQEDKDRIIAKINELEYAVPPRIVFTADQYEINQALLNEEKEITLLIGSSNEREVALEKDIQFILASFPMNERLVFNRTYAGYRGGLTFTEDLYDNL